MPSQAMQRCSGLIHGPDIGGVSWLLRGDELMPCDIPVFTYKPPLSIASVPGASQSWPSPPGGSAVTGTDAHGHGIRNCPDLELFVCQLVGLQGDGASAGDGRRLRFPGRWQLRDSGGARDARENIEPGTHGKAAKGAGTAARRVRHARDRPLDTRTARAAGGKRTPPTQSVCIVRRLVCFPGPSSCRNGSR